MSQITMRTEDQPGELVGRLRHSLHELNNALTPILANAQLARLMLETEETEVREAVDDIVEAAGRANALVAEMRQLTRSLHDTLEVADSDEKEVDDG